MISITEHYEKITINSGDKGRVYMWCAHCDKPIYEAPNSGYVGLMEVNNVATTHANNGATSD